MKPDVGLGGPPLDSLVTSFCSPLRLDNDSGGERDSLAFWFEDFGLASFSDDFERDSEEEEESSVFSFEDPDLISSSCAAFEDPGLESSFCSAFEEPGLESSSRATLEELGLEFSSRGTFEEPCLV